MRKIISTTALAFLSTMLFCQQKTVNGKVTTAKNEAVQYANIALVRNADDKTIKGSVTDSLGNFSISIVTNGIYKLVITNAGFSSYTSTVFTVDSATTVINMPAIVLTEQFKTNKAVVVQAKKKFIEIF